MRLDPERPFVALVFTGAAPFHDVAVHQYATKEELYDAIGGELPSDWNSDNSVLFLEMDWQYSEPGVLQASAISRTWTEHDLYRSIHG